MSDSFYLADGPGLFVPTRHTTGPWDPEAQHASPPAALLGRAVEGFPADTGPREEETTGRTVIRLTMEILRPIPLAPLQVSVRLVRPGRRVDLVEASLATAGVHDGKGEEVARATAWRIRNAGVPLPPGTPLPRDGAPPAPPEGGRDADPLNLGHEFGYFAAMECRFVHGSLREPGPAVAWLRMRVPLVAGETPSPLQRALAAADSGSGISAAVDLSTHVFINTEITVHLRRYPEGEWVCLDAATWVGDRGIGLTETALWDEQGRIGRAAQSLLIAPRS